MGALGEKIRTYGELVAFSHSVFMLPFALAAAVIAARGVEGVWWRVVLIITAVVGARTAAMAMNRIADRRFDAANPRTMNRPLVTGRVGVGEAWALVVGGAAVFLGAAWALGPVCGWLALPALGWILAYSYTKRFTSLSHLWLGVATALAPVGAWVGMRGELGWGVVILAVAVAAWVGGFDIIYALQDTEFDRRSGLKSLPAVLGPGKAMWISRGLHLVAAVGFIAAAGPLGLGELYRAGCWVLAGILAAEQIAVALRPHIAGKAFFTFNGLLSICFFLLVVADRIVEG